MRLSRYPQTIGGSVYSQLLHRLSAYEGEVYPFHIGDTWMEPPAGCWMEDVTVEKHPGMHKYAPPQGLPAFLQAAARRVEKRTGVETGPNAIGVTAGATGGLAVVVGAIVEPGDEVMILAPTWPLIVGMVHAFHGCPVHVPFFGEVDAASDIRAHLETYRTANTRALYLNTPNNPTGCVLPLDWMKVIVEWAREHDLWLIADEVYEDYQYEGEHVYCRTLAPERTFSSHSFSKAYGMAGNRLGYIVGPEAAIAQCRKLITHFYYGAPQAAQLAGLRILEGAGDSWVATAKQAYMELGTMAAKAVGVPAPQGSTFLFLDVKEVLDERGLGGLLEDCVDQGLFVAPGSSFGPYPTHIRVCFTAAEPPVIRRGFDCLAALLNSKR
jgi:aspartate/methionine/tyrosine aminotransferase